MSVSTKNRDIARHALEAFKGKPLVTRYWDDNHKSCIDILSSPGSAGNATISYSTLGLSDYPLGIESGDVPLGVELVGACYDRFECFPNVLSTCAFNIINSRASCFPGIIYNDIITLYAPESPMKHVMMVPPFLWEGSLKTLDFPEQKVAWLLAMPISPAELSYAEKKGTDALEELLEEHSVDVFDLNRSSVL